MEEDEIKVSDLSQAEDILSNDILMIVQSLYNKKVPFSLLKNKVLEPKIQVMTLSEELTDNSVITLDNYYKVGNGSLNVYFEGCLLIKDINYTEVGNSGALSNQIQLNNWGANVSSGYTFVFIIDGIYEN